eukprot:10272271-Alexandrium_andersonii.AAC.1
MVDTNAAKGEMQNTMGNPTHAILNQACAANGHPATTGWRNAEAPDAVLGPSGKEARDLNR